MKAEYKNISQAVTTFKKINTKLLPPEGGDEYEYPDGRFTTIFEQNAGAKSNTYFNFNLCRTTLVGRPDKLEKFQGIPLVANIEVDINTDPEGNVGDLNPLPMGACRGFEKYPGIIVDMSLNGKTYKVHYSSIEGQPGIAQFDAVYDENDNPEKLEKLSPSSTMSAQEELGLKDKKLIDVFATVFELMKPNKKIDDVLTNPFVLPEKISKTENEKNNDSQWGDYVVSAANLSRKETLQRILNFGISAEDFQLFSFLGVQNEDEILILTPREIPGPKKKIVTFCGIEGRTIEVDYENEADGRCQIKLFEDVMDHKRGTRSQRLITGTYKDGQIDQMGDFRIRNIQDGNDVISEGVSSKIDLEGIQSKSQKINIHLPSNKFEHTTILVLPDFLSRFNKIDWRIQANLIEGYKIETEGKPFLQQDTSLTELPEALFLNEH